MIQFGKSKYLHFSQQQIKLKWINILDKIAAFHPVDSQRSCSRGYKHEIRIRQTMLSKEATSGIVTFERKSIDTTEMQINMANLKYLVDPRFC